MWAFLLGEFSPRVRHRICYLCLHLCVGLRFGCGNAPLRVLLVSIVVLLMGLDSACYVTGGLPILSNFLYAFRQVGDLPSVTATRLVTTHSSCAPTSTRSWYRIDLTQCENGAVAAKMRLHASCPAQLTGFGKNFSD